MNSSIAAPNSARLARGFVFIAMMVFASRTQAGPPVLWTGPTITFTRPVNSAGTTDQLVAGVALARNSSGLLYNAVVESSAGFNSPLDTEWASGTLANFASLTFQNFSDWETGLPSTGGGPNVYDRILNVPAVVHLINENIYFSLTFTDWEPNHVGAFAYIRSTPAPPAPTASITSPAGGAVFAAPANVKLTASATVNGGTVTNVLFLGNGTALGSVRSSPFSITASNLAAAGYVLKAVSTAGGISTTSTAVNISVVAPVAVTLSSPVIGAGQLAFSYSADPGLRYVVQSSPDLVTWSSLMTNLSAGNPVQFSTNAVPNDSRYFRVGRLPNP